MVDQSEDKVCGTGQFEMAYKHVRSVYLLPLLAIPQICTFVYVTQPKLDTAVSLGIKMAIEGSAIPKPSPADKSKQQ